MNILNYKNQNWEPVFREISPMLSSLYFFIPIGVFRYFIASLIFKKLSLMEENKC